MISRGGGFEVIGNSEEVIGRGGVAVKGDMVYRLSEHMVYKYRYSLTA